MLVSFTGAQSTGKSTLLEECKKTFTGKWEFVPEVTRLIKRRHGVKINEYGTDKTQNYIIEAHIVNVINYHNDIAEGKVDGYILDRCILDGMVYTQYLYNHGQVKKSTLDYARGVCNLIVDKYDLIFYTDPNIPIVDDGERSVNEDFRKEIIEIFDRYIKLDVDRLGDKVKLLSGSVEERMKDINLCIKNLKNGKETTS